MMEPELELMLELELELELMLMLMLELELELELELLLPVLDEKARRLTVTAVLDTSAAPRGPRSATSRSKRSRTAI
ncbi:MAG TPA: hypothetical protein VIY52_29015 [Streptosporangiaceae bacterium]